MSDAVASLGASNFAKIENENVWNKLAENIDWFSTYSKTNDSSFHKPIKINWFEGGELNVSYNCLDRHLENNADKIAIIWESEDGLSTKTITYTDLHKKMSAQISRFLDRGIWP